MTPSLLLALRWTLGAVWGTAGAAKAGDAPSVSETIRNYAALPDGVVQPLARILPVAEVILGVALVAGVLPAVSGWLSLAAFSALAGAMTWNLARGRTFDCGCGLTNDTPISWRLVARNLALAAVSAAVALGPAGALAVLRGRSGSPSGGHATTALVAIPMIVILIAATARLLASVQPLQLRRGRRPATVAPVATNPGLSLVHVDGRNAKHKRVN